MEEGEGTERRKTPRHQLIEEGGVTTNELYRMFQRMEETFSDGITAIRRDYSDDLRIIGATIDKMTENFDRKIDGLTSAMLSSAVYMADMRGRDDRLKKLEDSITFLNRTVAGALITLITGILVFVVTQTVQG